MTCDLAAITEARLLALIEASLAQWQVAGKVERGASAEIVVRGGGIVIAIARAAAGSPFRWTVENGGQARIAGSVAGVLRALRGALDPDYRPVRLRIASLPEAAS